MINIGSTSCGGRVVNLLADLAKIMLVTPACTEVNEKVALSRKFGKTWRLIGELISFFRKSFRNSATKNHPIGWGRIESGAVLEAE